LGGGRRVTEGNKEGQFTSIREQRWTVLTQKEGPK
jgi:hypothetical protein